MNTQQSNRTPFIDPVIMSAMTGAGVGVGMAATFAIAALAEVPFGLPMAIALPAAMILAIGGAVLLTCRKNRRAA
ncbi:hypothetical protein QWJ90_05365 [Microbacterium oryzae]|uniref:hypothetical protein n=1 Tax=Microbacterium oryzae TaxID=743009 RepID=UPI0025B1F959|nr:hypothetical protein [Microbacterium oryzae]MDN3310349.1 hypothetical protein [Microbacterium oryzae]